MFLGWSLPTDGWGQRGWQIVHSNRCATASNYIPTKGKLFGRCSRAGCRQNVGAPHKQETASIQLRDVCCLKEGRSSSGSCWNVVEMQHVNMAQATKRWAALSLWCELNLTTSTATREEEVPKKLREVGSYHEAGKLISKLQHAHWWSHMSLPLLGSHISLYFSHTHTHLHQVFLLSACGGGCWHWLVSAVCKVAHASVLTHSGNLVCSQLLLQ